MDYHALEALRKRHPAWRLLLVDHAPFIVAFLHEAFTKPNRRTLAQSELIARLDDCLYGLRSELGEGAFPRSAADYASDWADDKQGWLRKFYPPATDEPHFDITPAVERAIEWIVGLEQTQFIGTESRLRTIFELLMEMARGTETDPVVRVTELERRRADIDAEIARIKRGEIDLMDATQLKERFQQVDQTARALLSDFRQVDQNFRELDRAVRERIALWEGGKGQLLERIFGERDAIVDSDQGKSFRAFWDFLMSPARQEELTDLLSKVFDLDPVIELQPDRRLLRVHYDWLQAGEVAQRTVARLSEQLRRYLDDKAWLENRRIMQLIREIEQTALSIRDRAPDGTIIELDEPAPNIDLTMDRPLFEPPLRPQIEQMPLPEELDVPYEALFDTVYVDKARLAANIRQALQDRSQISLDELVQRYPLEQGLAELVSYFSIAAETNDAIIDDTQRKTLTWTDQGRYFRQATLPLVIFCRAHSFSRAG